MNLLRRESSLCYVLKTLAFLVGLLFVVILVSNLITIEWYSEQVLADDTFKELKTIVASLEEDEWMFNRSPQRNSMYKHLIRKYKTLLSNLLTQVGGAALGGYEAGGFVHFLGLSLMASPSSKGSSRKRSESVKEKLYLQSPEHLKALSVGNLRLAVALPEGEDINEWLAVNTFDFFNHINMLFHTVKEFCTRDQCPIMSAGERYEFLWVDGNQYPKPTRLCAKEYIFNLMGWIQRSLDDEQIFPCRAGAPFPDNFQQAVRQIFKRLFRVYAHIYYSHFTEIILLEQTQHMNCSFKHFIFFIQEFHLVDRKELAPLLDLIALLTESE